MSESMLKISFRSKNILVICLTMIFELGFCNAFAQNISLKGKVVGSDNISLPGVNVFVKGTGIGTVTNLDGNFSLEVSESVKELSFSLIGYMSQDVKISSKTYFDIILKESNYDLNEVVVVGYGIQKKRDVTGSVSQVSNKQLTQVAAIGFDQAMQGRAAGVQVTNNSAEPGGSVSVRIRGIGSINGSSEPLYIIDGIPTDGGLNSINVADIESIDILKDAASGSIYGSRAANGVVIVTTKRGKKGDVKVSFDAYWGVQSVPQTFDLMNTTQFMEVANEAYRNARFFAGADSAKYPKPNPAWKINPDSSYRSTDWQEELFSASPIQSYNINVAGGTEKQSSSLSASYLNQDGILKGSEYERFTLRLTTDYKVNNWLRFGANMNFAQSYKESVATESNYRGAMQLAFNALPELPVYSEADGPMENPLYYGFDGYAFMNRYELDSRYYPQSLNPVYAVTESLEMWQKQSDFHGLAYNEIEPIKDLVLRTSFSYKKRSPENWSKNKLLPTQITMNPNDDLRHGTSAFTQSNTIVSLNYSKTINKHSFVLLGAYDVRIEDYVDFGSLAQQFQNEVNVSINAAAVKNAHGTYFRETFQSFIGRANYNYDNKLLFTGTVRKDGSSKFGPNRKYGVFPSASMAWRISGEDFMQQQEWLSDMKIRASYGVVGNDNIPSGRYYSLLRFQDVQLAVPDPALKILYAFGAAGKQQMVPGIEPAFLPDANIHWEESHEMNFGIDASMFENRLSFAFDLFKRSIKDMLALKSVPYSFGAPGNSVYTNFASMENKGVELFLGYNNRKGNFSYGIDANYSATKNMVTNLPEKTSQSLTTDVAGSMTNSIEGMPIAQFYGYRVDGIYQNKEEIANGVPAVWDPTPGDFRFKNLDGNEVVDDKDREYLGNGLPTHLFGLNLKAAYKAFDIALFINGQADVKAANLNRRKLYDVKSMEGANMVNAGLDLYNNRWHGEGTSNTVPKVSYNPTVRNLAFSDFYIEDASFVRFKNLQVGYTLPKGIMDKLKVDKFRFYVSLQNFLTLTKYSGLDPEVGSLNGNVLQTGMDYGRYPSPMIFMCGVNVHL